MLAGEAGEAARFATAFVVRLAGITGADRLDVTDLKMGPVPADSVIRAGGGLYPTCSLTFRKDAVDYTWFDQLPALYGDEVLILSLMANGTIYYTGRVTSVYRKWSGGIYSSISYDASKLAKQKLGSVDNYERFNEMTGLAYRRAVASRISKESLYVLEHLGMAAGYRSLFRLKPGDGARLVRNKLRRFGTRIRSVVGG